MFKNLLKKMLFYIGKNNLTIKIHAFNKAGKNDLIHKNVVKEIYQDSEYYNEYYTNDYMKGYLKLDSNYCFHDLLINHLGFIEKLNSLTKNDNLFSLYSTLQDHQNKILVVNLHTRNSGNQVMLLKYNNGWKLFKS